MNTSGINISIVVPCYNEEKNIPLLFQKFASAFKDRPDREIIFVNNGSTDRSSEVFKEELQKNRYGRLIFVPVNQGYGNGILAGLKETMGEMIGWTHADLQTDPDDVIRAYDIAKAESSDECFIKGNRKNRPVFDTFFTLGMSIFESIFLRCKLYDINAQPTLFPRKFFESWKNPPLDFSLDLYAYYLAKQKGLVIKRFPVLFPPRIHGTSSWNIGWKSKWKFIKRTLEYSLKLRKMLKQEC